MLSLIWTLTVTSSPRRGLPSAAILSSSVMSSSSLTGSSATASAVGDSAHTHQRSILKNRHSSGISYRQYFYHSTYQPTSDGRWQHITDRKLRYLKHWLLTLLSVFDLPQGGGGGLIPADWGWPPHWWPKILVWWSFVVFPEQKMPQKLQGAGYSCRTPPGGVYTAPPGP